MIIPVCVPHLTSPTSPSSPVCCSSAAQSGLGGLSNVMNTPREVCLKGRLRGEQVRSCFPNSSVTKHLSAKVCLSVLSCNDYLLLSCICIYKIYNSDGQEVIGVDISLFLITALHLRQIFFV